jgi:LuxR family maltose regulon positive regulatory protein
VSDFLASEVLDEMPAALHDFLLRSGRAARDDGGARAAVSGDARASDWFDEIERRGLFVTVLDAHERTLVLHDLFRDALLDRLRRRFPDRKLPLLRRAAEGERDPVRRVGFLLRAHDWPRAEAALAQAAPDLLLAGGIRELQRLIDAFPQPGATRHRACCAWPAWPARCAGPGSRWRATCRPRRWPRAAGATRAELDLAEAYLAGALYPLDQNADGEALIAGLKGRPLAARRAPLMLMADCSQHLRRGQMDELPALYGELLDLLEPQTHLLAWWESVPPFNWTTVPGMQPLLERYVQGALARIGGRPLPMRADVNLLRRVRALWQGRLPRPRPRRRGRVRPALAGLFGRAGPGARHLPPDRRRRCAARDEVATQLQWLFTREDGHAASGCACGSTTWRSTACA